MTYEVLARKWRPQTFDEVVAQEQISRTLVGAIERDRVAHAYLFSGPRGVGKTSMARILAKALNCQEGPNAHPCDRCSSCRQIISGASVDVLEIDGASNRGIDSVRELRENVKYLPAGSRYRIYIIDEVHMLTTEAFNALLKTLEEPPPHIKFIMATTEPHKLPLTILSRCQHFNFRRVPEALIFERLKRICAQDGFQVDDPALSLISREASGSMRDAESLLDQAISFSGQVLTSQDLEKIIGIMDEGIFFDILDKVSAQDGSGLFQLVAKVYDQGLALEKFWERLIVQLRDLIAVKLGEGDPRHLGTTPDRVEQLAGQAERFDLDALRRMWELLINSEYLIKRSASPRTALEMVLIKMMDAAHLLPLESVIARLEALERKLDLPGQLPRQQAGEEKSKSARQVFQELIAFVTREDPPLGAILEQGKLLALESDQLVVGFNQRSFFIDRLKEGGKDKRLEELCRKFMERPINLVLKGQAGNDPVQTTLETLGAKLVSIKEHKDQH